MIISVADTTAAPGDFIRVPVVVTGDTKLYSAYLTMNFNDKELDFVGISGENGTVTEWSTSPNGSVNVTVLNPSGIEPGPATLCTLGFYVKRGPGITGIILDLKSRCSNADGTSIDTVIQSGSVSVSDGSAITGSRGDVNDDASVDELDAVFVLRMSTQAPVNLDNADYDYPYNPTLRYRGDVNGDDARKSNDAILILRNFLGINEHLN